MAYTKDVRFSEANIYGSGPEDEDDVYAVEEFRGCVDCGVFTDYDGYGYPVKDGKADTQITILPSQIAKIPKDATHIVWYNR